MLRPLVLFVAAALAVTAAPAATAGPAAEPTAPLVRPGLTYTVDGVGCSFAFLFRGSDGRDYVATAGHCVLGDGAREVWRDESGPRVLTPDGRPVGRFAYARYEASNETGSAVDLGFIRLDRGLFGNPQMCGWGGPTALLTTQVRGRTELRHNGGGVVLGDTVPSRTAVTDRLLRNPRMYAVGALTFGDSGSGTITSDGTAVGVNVSIQLSLRRDQNGTFAYTIGMQRLDLAVAEASAALGVRLSLRTAPLAPPPLPSQRC
jgi:hypothetical protein